MPSRELTSSRNGTLYECQHSQYAKTVLGGDVGTRFSPVVDADIWGGETSFRLRLDTPIVSVRPTYNDAEKSVTWLDATNNVGLKSYGIDSHERGAFEFEILLLAVPQSPTMDLPFEARGLDLLWQPPLTKWERDRGNIRPANVVNSVAAYHARRTPFHTEPGAADKYKTGKAFHLYRPEAIDAVGRRHWVDWQLDRANSKFVLTFDAWFATATYPVVIDPTVGYTTAGSSDDSTGSYSLTVGFTASASGDANPGTAYLRGYNSFGAGTDPVYLGAYVHNASGPFGQTRLAASSGIVMPASDNWASAAITWTGITSSTTYFISAWSNVAGTHFMYDAGSATGWYRFTESASPPDPFPDSSFSGSFDNRLSAYVDYTASGGGGAAFSGIIGGGVGTGAYVIGA